MIKDYDDSNWRSEYIDIKGRQLTKRQVELFRIIVFFIIAFFGVSGIFPLTPDFKIDNVEFGNLC